MFDAFSILGATPTDSSERLQELLEEKELLSDDTSEVQEAYSDLTNLKKRLRHEIEYFCRDDFHDFRQMVNSNQKPTIVNIADIFINIGLWFEKENVELFDKINDARLVGGYSQIESENDIVVMMEKIRQECISSANSYLDGFDVETHVNIFNQIVKNSNFASFFIDELMAHYELTMSETLQSKEDECNKYFNEIESICDDFNSGESLSPDLQDKIKELEVVLKDWDHYAQPLQKNAQARGGQHEKSKKLVFDFRNRLIDLCYASQKMLQNTMDNLNKADFHTKYCLAIEREINKSIALEILEKKVNDSISFIEALIYLIQILSHVFAELEIIVEQLNEDKTQLIQLKKDLIKFRKQIRSAKRSSYNDMSYRYNKPSFGRVLLGFLAALCVPGTITGFGTGNIIFGVVSLILGLVLGICCIAFNKIKGL